MPFTAVNSFRALRSILLILAAAVAVPSSSAAEDPLLRGFEQPPAAARPRALWFWMNGHVSRDGITRDLEAMQRVGVGGVLMFDGGSYLPAGPAGYLEPRWRELMTHAIQEGRRLGVEVGMHNGPGWSSSGGPWITPERSMQQLVWTESTVEGPGSVDVVLPRPQANHGYYRDALVIAFPALSGERTPYETGIRRLTTGGDEGFEPAGLSDGRLDTAVAIAPGRPLLIEFAAPTEVHAVTANVAPGSRFPRLQLESSPDGATFSPVATVGSPGRHGIAAPGAASFPPVRARFYRIVPSGAAELAELVLHRSPRIRDWVFKANFAYRVGRQLEVPPTGGTAEAIDPAAVVDLSEHADSAGRLRWVAPPGAWTVLRLGHTTTGQLNVSASTAGTGLECDKFSAEAAEFHFQNVVGRILADAGPAAEAFTSVSIDSYEAGMQNWTADFPAEFARRAGYDLRPYLPAMLGRIVGDEGRSERFLYDVRRVQADLMTDAYYGKLAELCRARGLRFYVEGYGQGMFDEMHVSGLPDVPMSEFWTRTPWAPNRTVKMVASAAHVYGKPVVAVEAYTGEERTSRWLDYPYSLKVLGDDMFSLGVNQFVFHRYAHQPHPTAAPGMAMGPWGFHFERTNTWFDQSSGWLEYLARSQFLLQQGTYVADVLCFVGERPPNNAQFAMPVLPAGYNYDLVTAEVLLDRVAVRDGRLVLPEGGAYRVLLLPDNLQVMTPELARRLRELVEQGAVVVGPKPLGSPTLRGFPETDAEVRRIANELWSGPPVGRGQVIADRPVGDVLRELRVSPDFDYTAAEPDVALSWLHRRLSAGDVYFVANRQRRVAEFVASFRVEGRRPEIWNPQTGVVADAAVFSLDGGRVRVPLRLEPAESVFVLLRRPADSAPAASLVKDGQPVFDVAPRPVDPLRVTNTFTMSIWAKPDTELRLMPRESATGRLDETGKFYAIAAAEGDVLHGAGHALAGLAVGRNGAFVVERARTQSPAVLVAAQPIAGWTHFAVVYRDGTPRLYIDGRFIREGLRSGAIVHPGVGSPPPLPETVFHFAALASVTRASGVGLPPSQGRAFLFEGNVSRAEVSPEALSDDAVAALAARGLPAPETPVVTGLSERPDGRTAARIWQPGRYTLGDGEPVDVAVHEPLTLGGPWHVAFPAGHAAPAEISLPRLESLHRHDDPGVRHFSGTASYTHPFDLAAEAVAENRRVVLDLGRVEVVAEVRVNGRTFPPLWKEPYRVDITDAVRPGSNQLEVRVANLWANRLIGDAQRPEEYAYATDGEHGIREVPEWYLNGEPEPAGGRTTFVTWRFFDGDEPLLESGLIGPVRVLQAVDVVLPRP